MQARTIMKFTFTATIVLLCSIMLQTQVNGVELKNQNDNGKPMSNDDIMLMEIKMDKDDENDIDPLQDRDFKEPLPNDEGNTDGDHGSDTVEMELLFNEASFKKNDGERHDKIYNDDDRNEPSPVNMELYDDEFIEEHVAQEQSSYLYAQKYDKQVIYIESYRRRGRWLDASHRFGWAYFSEVPEESVVDKLGVKWRVRNVGEGQVVLESMRYKHHFLNAHHSHWCKVTYSSYPAGQNWAKFRIENKNGRFFFQSTRYHNLRLDEYESWISKYWAALTEGQGVYAQFRIYTPPVSDYYKTVATLDNSKGTQAREFQYQEEIGISITNGHEISVSVSAEIGGEIKAAFTVGLSASSSWKHFRHSTYDKKKTFSVTTKVLPGKILHVRQLVGKYGHYLVQAKHFAFVNVNSQASTQEVTFASGIDEYNRGVFFPGPPDTDLGKAAEDPNVMLLQATN